MEQPTAPWTTRRHRRNEELTGNEERLTKLLERQGWADSDGLDYSDFRMKIQCQRPDFVRRSICINPADLDQDGLPDGYQSTPGCYGGRPRSALKDAYTKRNCFEKECGRLSAFECFAEVCGLIEPKEDLERQICEGFNDEDRDGISISLKLQIAIRCAHKKQKAACDTSTLHCFLSKCASSIEGMPGICADAFDRDSDGIPDGYNDPRFALPVSAKTNTNRIVQTS